MVGALHGYKDMQKYIYIYTHTHIYTYTHIYIYIHMHIHINKKNINNTTTNIRTILLALLPVFLMNSIRAVHAFHQLQ